MQYVYAFVIGGLLCVIAQILIDKTKLTPANILVMYVTVGAIISALGWYQPLVDLAGAGATVPLTGFGHSLAQGAIKAVDEKGLIGALSGGLSATSAGISAAVVFGYIISLIFKPKTKK
jgi:stage V sporulation protein AE